MKRNRWIDLSLAALMLMSLGVGAGFTAEPAAQDAQMSQLQELQAQLRVKDAEIAAARADGSTTLDRWDALQQERFALERRYRSLAGSTGTDYAAHGPCGCGMGISPRHGHEKGHGSGHGPGYGGHRGPCWGPPR